MDIEINRWMNRGISSSLLGFPMNYQYQTVTYRITPCDKSNGATKVPGITKARVPVLPGMNTWTYFLDKWRDQDVGNSVF